jgi:16S rRNA (cytosine1402-N4)-methyltransferase
MMAGRGGSAVAGGLARHVPVLARPALELLKVRDGGVYVDGTFGAGGYSRAILAAADAQVVAIDRDRDAVARGADLVEASGGRLTLIEARFSELDRVARKFGHPAVDGVVLDLGVSSMQLDEAERGFSFRLEGPLDMRMGADGPSAADVVARASERELADIVFHLGEERHSRAVPAPSSPPAPRPRSGRRGRWPRSSRAWCMRARGPSTRRRAPSRRCAFSSTRSSPSLPQRSEPPSAS